MFTRAALQCRIPRVRQFSLPSRIAVIHSRFLLPRPRLFTSASLPSNGVTIEQYDPKNLLQPALKNSDDSPEFISPPYCPGCGAPSQQIDTNLPGYYSSQQSKRQRYGPEGLKIKTQRRRREDDIYEQALQRVKAEREVKRLEDMKPTTRSTTENTEESAVDEPNTPQKGGLEEIAETAERLADLKSQTSTPVCARCHMMVHHHSAPPLPSYPTLDTLTNLLQGSSHKKNHIYHLIDAADLPMSLISDLRNHLYTTLPREILKGLTISYVVTRSDLLMPTEKQLGSLMTWMKKVVKNALAEGEKVEGHRDTNTRFRAVSASKGWGIGAIKSETRHREGGVWVVGAVNVGKSRLVREVWPEAGRARAGTLEEADEFDLLPEVLETALGEEIGVIDGGKNGPGDVGPHNPRQKMGHWAPTQVSPTVSDIPGTTAAPIRVMYKTAGKRAMGELIDLPGLERWIGFGDNGLLPFVREDKRKEFGMEEKIRPKQYTIKPGQSMVIAGLIMITPQIPPEGELVILAYPFTALPVHITSTTKALQLISEPNPQKRFGVDLFQKSPPPIESPSYTGPEPTHDLAKEVPYSPIFTQAAQVHPGPSNLPPHFASAGTFPLSDDVTSVRNPLLPSKDPKDLAKLPYRIIATDILLSGIGWVELIAQVRRRKEEEGLKVQVEVFTPEGKGVGSRTTMSADMLRKKGAQLAGVAKKSSARPRRSMKGDKKRKKLAKRAVEAQGGT